MWYVSVKSGKIKAIKMPGSLSCLLFLVVSGLPPSVALSMIQKQLTPIFLAIPSQYCLKCVVISLRLDVGNFDSGLAIGFLCIFGILMFCLVKISSCSAIRCSM